MSRYPYTEACDLLRSITGTSRADATIAIDEAAKALNIPAKELSAIFADAGRYRAFMPQLVNAIRQCE